MSAVVHPRTSVPKRAANHRQPVTELLDSNVTMRMTRRRTHASVQPGSRNVYADLGFPNPDAMLRKARIASEISMTLKAAGLTQIAAARRIGVPHATFLRAMRGEFTHIAERTLKGWLARLCEN
jgi:predicted XRE-type DNA-binding protein